jgi:hypothetical protein
MYRVSIYWLYRTKMGNSLTWIRNSSIVGIIDLRVAMTYIITMILIYYRYFRSVSFLHMLFLVCFSHKITSKLYWFILLWHVLWSGYLSPSYKEQFIIFQSGDVFMNLISNIASRVPYMTTPGDHGTYTCSLEAYRLLIFSQQI